MYDLLFENGNQVRVEGGRIRDIPPPPMRSAATQIIWYLTWVNLKYLQWHVIVVFNFDQYNLVIWTKACFFSISVRITILTVQKLTFLRSTYLPIINIVLRMV